MKKSPPLIFLILLACLFPLGFQGCSGDRAQTDNGGLIRVKATGTRWHGQLPLWIGIEKGFFRGQGFSVEWQEQGNNLDSLNAISSGQAQVATPGETEMLVAMALGNTHFYWVARPGVGAGLEGLVAAPGISRFEELKGRRLGYSFASSAEITCRQLLKKHGLRPGRDVALVNLEPSELPIFFKAGKLDAAVAREPVLSQLRTVEGATMLGLDTDTEGYQRFGSLSGPEVLTISSAWIDEDPQRAKKFLSAYFQAIEWIAGHSREAVEIAAEKYMQQDAAQLAENLSRFTWYDLAKQKQIMREGALFEQTEYLLQILYEEMHAIPSKPDFRKWLNPAVLP